MPVNVGAFCFFLHTILNMSYAEKVVIVTGASSGIGAAIAIKLAAEGAQLALVARNQDKLRTGAQKCSTYGKEPLVIIADITSEDDVKSVVSKTVQNYGKIDVLINNAGVGTKVLSIEEPKVLEAFDKVIATNLRSVVQITNLTVPYLIQSRGNIVNISSIAGIKASVSTGFIYNCSKAALDQFARSIALELAPEGVRVNNVSPGPVRTDIMLNMGLNATVAEQTYDNLAQWTPLHRVSDAHEVAELVAFLASHRARSVTGATYVIDCGSLLK